MEVKRLKDTKSKHSVYYATGQVQLKQRSVSRGSSAEKPTKKIAQIENFIKPDESRNPKLSMSKSIKTLTIAKKKKVVKTPNT